MTSGLAIDALIYVHIISLSLWSGGLFAYVLIVWPAILSNAAGEFPRGLLAAVAMRTAPWIYLAMASALASFVGLWALGAVRPAEPVVLGYALLLIGAIANNVYGTAVAWPRIMLLPRRDAVTEWFWFRLRMSIALIVGLTLNSAAIIYHVRGH